VQVEVMQMGFRLSDFEDHAAFTTRR
jgi:hypothetical protein